MTIGQLIAWVESKGNLEALRFEPAVYMRNIAVGGGVETKGAAGIILARIVAIHNCSWHTALMIFSSSWGATQLMGFNLYGQCGYGRSVARYLANDVDQAACFGAFLLHAGLNNVTPEQLAMDQQARLKFAMTYNGAIAYADSVASALRHFGFAVT